MLVTRNQVRIKEIKNPASQAPEKLIEKLSLKLSFSSEIKFRL